MENRKNGIVLIALIIIIVLAIGSTIFLISMISGGGNEVAKRTTEDFEKGILDYSFNNYKWTADVTGLKDSVNKDDVAEITIPSVVIKDGKEYNVEGIKGSGYGSYFRKCGNLNTIRISEGIKEINEWAFMKCESLKKVVLPNSVTKIEKDAFKNDKNLEEINIPNNIKIIEENTFYECENLKEIVLPEGVEEIKDCAFSRVYTDLQK